jgi:hypothetical protein
MADIKEETMPSETAMEILAFRDKIIDAVEGERARHISDIAIALRFFTDHLTAIARVRETQIQIHEQQNLINKLRAEIDLVSK